MGQILPQDANSQLFSDKITSKAKCLKQAQLWKQVTGYIGKGPNFGHVMERVLWVNNWKEFKNFKRAQQKKAHSWMKLE